MLFHCFKSALVVFGHVIVRRIFKIKHDIVGFVLSDIADFEQKFGKEFACFVGRFLAFACRLFKEFAHKLVVFHFVIGEDCVRSSCLRRFSDVEICKARRPCKDVQNADNKCQNRNDKACGFCDGHCVHTQKFKPESADAIPEQIENHQNTGILLLIISLPHPHAEDCADCVPNAFVEERRAKPVSAAARLNMRINDVSELAFHTAGIGDIHAEREELKSLVRDWQSKRLLIDEVAPSADNLTDKHGHYDEIDDVEKVGLLFVAKSEKYRAQKSAQKSADDGDTTLPNCDYIDEFVPAFKPVVAEILLCARENVQPRDWLCS